jgi:hypothetical protein
MKPVPIIKATLTRRLGCLLAKGAAVIGATPTNKPTLQLKLLQLARTTLII